METSGSDGGLLRLAVRGSHTDMPHGLGFLPPRNS